MPSSAVPERDEGLLLAIDIGNSQISTGLGDEENWRLRWRLASDRRRTSDEYAALFSALLESEGVPTSAVDRIVLTSVVPELAGIIEGMCLRLFGIRPLVVGPGIRTGMALKYDPPSALGSDRLVDAIAARARYGAPVIVVDFGTATTFNVVNAAGDFIGGAIAPGVQVAAAALAAAGARLNRIDLSPPDPNGTGLPVVGKNTEQGMRSGILHGYAGLVDGMLSRISRELHELEFAGYVNNTGHAVVARGEREGGAHPPMDAFAPQAIPFIATGGMARSIAPLVERFTAVEPDLILDGLRIIDRLNPQGSASRGSSS